MSTSQYNYCSSECSDPRNGFCAKLTNPKILVQILKMLNFREDVTINVGINGLKITAEIAKSFQANAFIQRETFTEYKVGEELEDSDHDTVFNISLTTLIHCINLCGTGTGSSSNATATLGHTNFAFSNSSITTMVLYCPDVGDPLRIWLEEDGVISGTFYNFR